MIPVPRRLRSCVRASSATLLLAATLLPAWASAQGPPERGPRQVDPRWHALVHATVVPRPGEVIEDATVVMRDGLIVQVAAGAEPPAGARVWDSTGLTVYAGLIEPYLTVEAPAAPGEHWLASMVSPQRSALDGPGVPDEVRAELRALGFTAAALAPADGVLRGRGAVVSLGDAADELRAESAEVISDDAYQVIAFQTAGFRGGEGAPYPTSQMGAIALVRQTFLDAARRERCLEVYARDVAAHEPPPEAPELDALARTALDETPLLFVSGDELQTLRAARLAHEFERPMIVRGSGTEFRRLEAIAGTQLPILVPLDFPEPPDVATRAKAENVSLRELMTWEQAPTNPRRLVEAGVTVAFTSDQLDDRKLFRERVRTAIEHGLAEDQALAMLTTVPARLLDLEERIGEVAPGLLANLVVCDGTLFAKDAKVRAVWVGGRRYEIEAAPGPDRDGKWVARFEGLGDESVLEGKLSIEDGKKVELELRGKELEARHVELAGDRLHFQFDGKELGLAGVLSCSASFEEDLIYGTLSLPDGRRVPWSATRAPDGEPAAEEPAPEVPAAEAPASPEPIAKVPEDAPEGAEPPPAAEAPAGVAGEGLTEPVVEVATETADEGEPDADDEDDANEGEEEDKDEEAEESPAPTADIPETFGLPFGAYGLDAPPEPRTVRVEGATIWTASDEGIIEDGVLVVENGRVCYVGPAEGAPSIEGALVIDARGKHLTPGLIDCHSHTGISGGVNETGRRVSSEVRIADVIDPDDISYYHQLAGGLTAANQLHGSANAIGGQNSVVKLRWGAIHPDDLRLDGAPPGIKFALGENPKRVAAGTEIPDEYPQTRMGVEALIRDRLCAGRDYRAEWDAYEALSDWERRAVMPPRRDLELEALGEIMAGERLVHCHSYRQDEILMLARLSQELGFTIGTFQHVLEGYKVAEVIEQTAMGASTFADWWAYKFEVIDAIPYNAEIMSAVGVVVSINSDSDEHARRLNTEAGKCVKYGGMDPHEALKLVTLNPAIQLGVDERIGSLRAGKDADFAIWSGSPLSYASRCEATWIDGAEYFSLARDAELRAQVDTERQRILQKLLSAGAKERGERGERGGGRGPRPTPTDARLLSLQEEYEALWRAGVDPDLARPGVCGCDEDLRRELEAHHDH